MDDLIFEDFADHAAIPGVKARLEAKARLEGCGFCRRHAPPFVVGYHRGNFIALCLECGDLNFPVSFVRDGRRRPVFLSIPGPWFLDDARWFRARAHRRLRLRRSYPCEMRMLGFEPVPHVIIERSRSARFFRAGGNFAGAPDDDVGLAVLLDSGPPHPAARETRPALMPIPGGA